MNSSIGDRKLENIDYVVFSIILFVLSGGIYGVYHFYISIILFIFAVIYTIWRKIYLKDGFVWLTIIFIGIFFGILIYNIYS